MRSSKSRSRNKSSNSNRNRSGGVNVVNRVFDSSGPEGKVRGTPQQIIDKYTQLARDAQLSNDRVAAENFQQHGEHYIRLLAEAQREIDAKREQQELEQQQQRERQQEREQREQREPREPRNRPEQSDQNQPPAGQGDQPDFVRPSDHEATDSGLVETPEQMPVKRKPRSRKPKVEKPDSGPQPDTSEAAE